MHVTRVEIDQEIGPAEHRDDHVELVVGGKCGQRRERRRLARLHVAEGDAGAPAALERVGIRSRTVREDLAGSAHDPGALVV
ncbi:hypothetical protein [Promicromonospora soli]